MVRVCAPDHGGDGSVKISLLGIDTSEFGIRMPPYSKILAPEKSKNPIRTYRTVRREAGATQKLDAEGSSTI